MINLEKVLKIQKLIYSLSLLTLGIALFLIVNYPDSGRMNMIGGGLTTLGFILNIVGYFTQKRTQNKGLIS